MDPNPYFYATNVSDCLRLKGQQIPGPTRLLQGTLCEPPPARCRILPQLLMFRKTDLQVSKMNPFPELGLWAGTKCWSSAQARGMSTSFGRGARTLLNQRTNQFSTELCMEIGFASVLPARTINYSQQSDSRKSLSSDVSLPL